MSLRLACGGEVANTDGPAKTKEQLERREWLFSGIRERLSKLKSGAYIATGTVRSFEDRTKGEPREIRVDSVFSGVKLRFLHSTQGRIFPSIVLPADADLEKLKREGVDVDRTRVREGLVESRFIRNESERGRWVTGRENATIEPAMEKRVISEVVWDVRAIGLLSIIGFRKGEDAEACLNVWEKAKDFNIIDDEDGRTVYEVHYVLPNVYMTWRLELDPNNGLTPTSVKCIERKNGSTEWKVEQHHGSAWEAISGAWVPKSCYFQLLSIDTEEMRERIDVNFTWSQVNDDVPDTEFALDRLDLPAEVGILDTTHGQKAVILREGVPIIPLQRHVTLEPVLTKQPGFRIRWWLIVAGNLIGLTVVVLLVQINRRRPFK